MLNSICEKVLPIIEALLLAILFFGMVLMTACVFMAAAANLPVAVIACFLVDVVLYAMFTTIS